MNVEADQPKQKQPRRYRLTMEYDGTNFSGWQKQLDARTVQGDLWKGATRLFGDDIIDIQGCGRTDGGVHALRYTAHLEVTKEYKGEDLVAALNETLPKDIAVIAVERAGPRFHARHNCIARSYIYQIQRRKSAFGKRYSWWVRDPLDLLAMRRGCSEMVGMHDFAVFAEKPELKKSTQVLVHMIHVGENDDLVTIRVIGSHFLWRMVRRMAGVLVEVGAGRLAVEDLVGLMSGPPVSLVQHTAPAAGLFFERAFYDEEELADFIRQAG